MQNKNAKVTELRGGKLVIAGREIPIPLTNHKLWKIYELPDKLIAFFDIIDHKGFLTDANVFAYDFSGRQLWQVEAIRPRFGDRVGIQYYVGFGWDEESQGYYLNSFIGESVRVDLESGKITHEGLFFK